MINVLPHRLRGIFFAIAGFAFWVITDACMKFAGEVHLPPYEVVGILGLFAAGSLVVVQAPRGKLKELWPKRPEMQLGRALLTFGCVMANTVALKHLPLTLFYIAVFTAPMTIAVLASVFLREHLGWSKIAAIVVGFIGVVIAIDPWNNLGGGDWVGYAAATASVLFFAAMTIWMRVMTRTETPVSITFFTGLVEGTLGLGGMLIGQAVPVWGFVLVILVIMGIMNVLGNFSMAMALKDTKAATVKQFHYTQLVTGALIGYVVWHEVLTPPMLIGAAIIIASGLYVAAWHDDSAVQS